MKKLIAFIAIIMLATFVISSCNNEPHNSSQGASGNSLFESTSNSNGLTVNSNETISHSNESSSNSNESSVSNTSTSDSTSDPLGSDNNSSVPSATSSGSEESEIQVDINDWKGKYTYGFEVFNEKGDFEYGFGYDIKIYEENGKYYGRVGAGGRQLDQDFIVEFEEHDNRLDAYLIESFGPIWYFPYEINTKMFSLIRRDNNIYTFFHAYYVEGSAYKKGEETIVFKKISN